MAQIEADGVDGLPTDPTRDAPAIFASPNSRYSCGVAGEHLGKGGCLSLSFRSASDRVQTFHSTGPGNSDGVKLLLIAMSVRREVFIHCG